MESALKLSSSIDVDSLEKKLLFINIAEKDQPENLQDNFIQHKIDGKNINQIKWSKLQNLFMEQISEYSYCHYELRIYNAETEADKENVAEILAHIQAIAEGLNCTCEIIRTKQGIFGFFFEFLIKSAKAEIISFPKEILAENSHSDSSVNLSSPAFLKSSKIEHFNKTPEIRYAVFGEESSGKSTTISVIINDSLDDGNGLMRKKNFRFLHEFQSGKTLSISHLFYGLDKSGNKLNFSVPNSFKTAEKFINLYDMGGSEKAMKNTLSLISPDYIDYALVFVDFKTGPTENTKIFYSLNLSIHIPVISVITKVDLVPGLEEKIMLNFIENLIKFLKVINESIKPLLIKDDSDIENYISELDNYSYLGTQENLMPIICVSNITGSNIKLLTNLINKLKNTLSRTIPLVNNYTKINNESKISLNLSVSNRDLSSLTSGETACSFKSSKSSNELDKYLNTPSPNPSFSKLKIFQNLSLKNFNFSTSPQSQFDIHEHFIVDNKTILGGVISKGRITKGEIYFFGPNKLGNFKKVTVSSLHCKKQSVNFGFEGQFCSMSLEGNNYDPTEVRKGMCLLSLNVTPKCVKRFKADVWWIGEENIKEIKYKYEPIVIINHIRQSCKIIYEKQVQNISGQQVQDEDTTSGDFSKSITTSSYITSSVEFEEEGSLMFGQNKRKKRRIKSNLKEKTFFISRNEKIELLFEFKNSPEYLSEGSNLIINDNNFKAFGIVTKII